MRFTEKNCCFGYIIPQTNIVGDNQISTVMLGKSDISDEASVSVICQNYIVGEPIRQFGLIEDVLEKHNVESVEELDLILQGLAKVHKENADLKNELSELKQKAIVPKFEVDQILFRIDFGSIVPFLVNEIYGHIKADETISIQYFDYVGLVIEENELFATREEAEKKLAEIRRKYE